MELITYNAMYAGNWLRMQDISHTFPHGVVGIQGAKQKRDPEAPAYKTRKTGRHVVFDFPHPNTGNRKGGPLAGVAILLPHGMATGISMIKYPTARRLQGRGGLIRVKLPDGRDYAFITIYARVEEPGDSEDEVNNALWEWAESELRELPTRCTPVIFTDANGHTGKGHDTTSSSHGIGPEGAEKENKNGKLLREFCERTDMVAINTWWPRGGGATYFTAREIDGRLRKYSSRIDYELIPKGDDEPDTRLQGAEEGRVAAAEHSSCAMLPYRPRPGQGPTRGASSRGTDDYAYGTQKTRQRRAGKGRAKGRPTEDPTGTDNERRHMPTMGRAASIYGSRRRI